MAEIEREEYRAFCKNAQSDEYVWGGFLQN